MTNTNSAHYTFSSAFISTSFSAKTTLPSQNSTRFFQSRTSLHTKKTSEISKTHMTTTSLENSSPLNTTMEAVSTKMTPTDQQILNSSRFTTVKEITENSDGNRSSSNPAKSSGFSSASSKKFVASTILATKSTGLPNITSKESVALTVTSAQSTGSLLFITSTISEKKSTSRTLTKITKLTSSTQPEILTSWNKVSFCNF